MYRANINSVLLNFSRIMKQMFLTCLLELDYPRNIWQNKLKFFLLLNVKGYVTTK